MIAKEEAKLEQLETKEAQLTDEVQSLATQGAELEFECSWIAQRENLKFESLMTQEVSCHLLSNKPFVCSLHSSAYIS